MRILNLFIFINLFFCNHSLAQVKETNVDTYIYKPENSVDTIKLKQEFEGLKKYFCKWGDSTYMELHSNGLIYQFKKEIADGYYCAFFDLTKNDTAMTAIIKNGRINGLLRRWSNDDKKIEEECEYVNGKMNGYRKLYYFSPEGSYYLNIMIMEKNVEIKVLQNDW